MWEKPWGYKEGFVVCAGLFLIGILLQTTIGKIDWEMVASPVNIILFVIYVSALVVMHISSRKFYPFLWMSRYTAVIPAMTGVVLLTVIMGLIRQLQSQQQVEGIEAVFGFSQMLSSWSFVLLFTWFTTLLGMTTLRKLFPFRWRNIPFILNHLGLFIALVCAVLGSADMQRLKMTTFIGKAEWRAYDSTNNLIELPLAVELKSFTIDEYPPKLMLIDNETGKALPEGKPANILLEESVNDGRLLDWNIKIDKVIPDAATMTTEDTLKFVDFHSMGATYATYIKASNSAGKQMEGWVSCGSFMFPYKALRLNENVSLVMPEREPRRFASEVVVYTESGEKLSAVIEVNKPLEAGGWKIYQLSYDESKGKWSDVSIFELVHDPWLPFVYAGIWMMIAGAVCLFVTAQRRKEETV